MKIQFLGASQFVTGSCYLLQVSGKKILIDCGMFQGLEIEDWNWKAFAFKPSEIDAAILTHAHLDHSGLLPKLYKEGFTGPVFMTLATREILEHMLLDSAKVQEIRYLQNNDKEVKGKKVRLALSFDPLAFAHLLYDTKDVMGLLKNTRESSFGEEFIVTEGVKAKFIRAGHVLGAASVVISANDAGTNKNVVFSGDLGNPELTLDTKIDYPKYADFVVMEALYGDSDHPDRAETENKFKDVINSTLSKGGNVIIPSFSLQRSQEILYMLVRFINNKLIPGNVRIYLDSPLSITITEIYKKRYHDLDDELVKAIDSGNEIFNHPNIEYVSSHKRSMKIRKKRGVIIIAGNGMCMGGRVLSHLAHNLPFANSTVALVGYQAEGTLGKELSEHAKEVIIEGLPVQVKSEIHYFQAFSAHPGQSGLLKWVNQIKKSTLKSIFLVHSDKEKAEVFKGLLENKGFSNVVIPAYKDTVEV